MSDEQGELNFADAPVSLATVRATKAYDGRLWTPRDALIDLLRDIDGGKINPQLIVITAKTTAPDGSYKLLTCSAGGANRHELIGVLSETVRTMIMTDISANEKLVEELAQAIATDDAKAAGVAAIVIVGKVLDLFERHTVALETLAATLGGCVDQHPGANVLCVKTS